MKIYAILIILTSSMLFSGCSISKETSVDATTIKELHEKRSDIEYQIESLIGDITPKIYPFYDEETKKMGYFNDEDQQVISPMFDSASLFVNGYADVSYENKQTMIDGTGSLVKYQIDRSNKLTKINEFVKKLNNYNEYKTYQSGSLYGIKDFNGKVIVKAKYKEIKLMSDVNFKYNLSELNSPKNVFIGDYAVVNNGKNDILVNKSGEEISDLDYEKIELYNDFVLGFNPSKDSKVYVLDLSNLKNSKEFLSIDYISKEDSVAIAKNNDGFMIIDAKGNILSNIYKRAHIYPDTKTTFVYNGTFAFSDDNKTYLINKTGKEFHSFNKSFYKFDSYSTLANYGEDKDGSGEYFNFNEDIIATYKNNSK